MKKLYCVISNKNRKFEKPKISYLLEKILVLSIIAVNVQMKMKKHLKKKNKLKY